MTSQIFKFVAGPLISCIFFYACTSGHSDHADSFDSINRTDSLGLKQGLWEIVEDSALMARGTFVDGHKEGLWTSWYKNGHMKEEGHYKEGLRNGMWVEWYSDGEIMWKGQWDMGSREIYHPEGRAKMSIIGQEGVPDELKADTIYRISIRIQNIPVDNLFVEVDNGVISREENSDLFLLETPSGSVVRMAVGYLPDPEFKDFRNLESEFDFRIEE